MKNLLKKSLLAGLGAVSMTKDKAEAVARELIDRGEVTKEEAKDLVDEMMQRGEEEQRAVKDSFRQEMEDFKKKMGLVTKEELKAFEDRLSRIEGQLTGREGQ